MVRQLLALVIAVVSAAPAEAQADGRARAPRSKEPVAIVAAVSGSVTATDASNARRSLRLFDRLEVSHTIETGRDADATLIFRSGLRVKVMGASRVKVESDGLVTVSGSTTTLAPVPTVPLISPVTGAGTTITAVRIRAGTIGGLSPAHGVATLTDRTVLAFAAVAVVEYDVEIEAPDASLVFRTQTAETRVAVPPTVLRPGRIYRWRVVARSPAGFERRGEGQFRTLDEPSARLRARFREAFPGPDAEALALLAEIDWTLGLWGEALSGFHAARSAGATDIVIAERIADIERRLAGPDSPLVP
jgi:hypothetical protein